MDNKQIFDALSDIKERTVRVETKVDHLTEYNKKLDQVSDTAEEALSEAQSAQRRINVIDRWMFAIGSTVILAIVTGVLSLIIIQ